MDTLLLVQKVSTFGLEVGAFFPMNFSPLSLNQSKAAISSRKTSHCSAFRASQKLALNGKQLFRKSSFYPPRVIKLLIKSAETDLQESATVEPEFSLSLSIQSDLSHIQVVDINENSSHALAGLRLLLLDDSGNIHSVYNKKSVWSEAYWDEVAVLPPVIPSGPVGFLGLAGGTSVRLFRKIWPELEIHAWEIDPVVLDVAKDFFGLSDLEGSSGGGSLKLHCGDALKITSFNGKFSGLVVDLFSNGTVIPELENADTWHKLKGLLRPGGRIIANLGGPVMEPNGDPDDISNNRGEIAKEKALKALAEAFDDEVSVYVTKNSDMNTLCLTGVLPCAQKWASDLPDEIKASAYEWKQFGL